MGAGSQKRQPQGAEGMGGDSGASGIGGHGRRGGGGAGPDSWEGPRFDRDGPFGMPAASPTHPGYYAGPAAFAPNELAPSTSASFKLFEVRSQSANASGVYCDGGRPSPALVPQNAPPWPFLPLPAAFAPTEQAPAPSTLSLFEIANAGRYSSIAAEREQPALQSIAVTESAFPAWSFSPMPLHVAFASSPAPGQGLLPAPASGPALPTQAANLSMPIARSDPSIDAAAGSMSDYHHPPRQTRSAGAGPDPAPEPDAAGPPSRGQIERQRPGRTQSFSIATQLVRTSSGPPTGAGRRSSGAEIGHGGGRGVARRRARPEREGGARARSAAVPLGASLIAAIRGLLDRGRAAGARGGRHGEGPEPGGEEM